MGRKRKKQASSPGEKLVCTHSQARRRFQIEETLEAGMALSGSEVKSMRTRGGDLDGSYASIHGDEVWLHNMHIPPYEQAGPHFGHEPRRSRKLLMHRREIERLRGKLAIRGYTLVPLRVYFKNGWAKVELGLGKGKRIVDRREEIKRRTQEREARAAMQRERKGE